LRFLSLLFHQDLQNNMEENPTIKPLIKTLLISMFVLGFQPFFAQNNWKLIKDEKNIQIYLRKEENSKYLSFKAKMNCTSSIESIFNQIKNVSNYPKWFAFTKSTTLLRQNKSGQFFYMETNYLWPYDNESMNYDMTFQKTKNSYFITISGSKPTIETKRTLKKVNGYILIEQLKNKSQITYYMHSEPSQKIPA